MRLNLPAELACEQALLFGRVSRERAGENCSFLSPSLARSREAHFACPNRRVCSRAKSSLAVRCRRRLNGPCHAICYPGSLFIIRLYLDIEAVSCFLLEGVGDSLRTADAFPVDQKCVCCSQARWEREDNVGV